MTLKKETLADLLALRAATPTGRLIEDEVARGAAPSLRTCEALRTLVDAELEEARRP